MVVKMSLNSRKNWALIMQERYALNIYKAYWAIGDGQITEFDAYAETEDAAMKIDASGIDKMIEPDTGVRHIAQRFRTLSELKDASVVDPDFSIRRASYSDQDTEYDKLFNAYRNNGDIPRLYSFGIGAAISKADCLEMGFKDFYFFDLPRFLKLVDSGHIEAVASYPNGDGSEALYYSIDDLRDSDVIQDEISGQVLSSAWEDRPVSNDFPTAPGIDKTGQVNLFDFGDGE